MSTYQDGVLEFGTQLVNLGAGALATLIADEIEIDDPTKVLTRMNNQGVPTAELQIDDVMTGTMTLQLTTPTIALPPKGTYFKLTDVTGTTLNFKVNKFGRKWKNDAETKIPMTFRQAFNAPAN